MSSHMDPSTAALPVASSLRGVVGGVSGLPLVPAPQGVLLPGQDVKDYDHAVWTTPVRHFCESAHSSDPNQPEYFSAFSSLLITLVALLVLFSGRHHNVLTKLCAAVLAWCGIGSFGFHWTLSAGWSFIDTFPMTLSAGLGLYLGWLVLAGLCTPLRHSRSGSVAMSVVSLLASFLILSCLVLNAVYGNVAYDNIFALVGAALLATILVVRSIIVRRQRKNRQHAHTRWGVGKDRSGSKEGPLLESSANEDTTDGSSSDGSITGSEDRWALEASASIEVLQPVLSQDDDEEAGAERRKRREGRSLSVGALGERKRRFTRLLARDQCLSVMVLGMLCAVLAGAVWEASEQLCPKPQWAWLRYLRLHSFWHLAIGYGTCLILQAFTFLSAPVLYGCKAHWANRLPSPLLNTILPEVVYINGPRPSFYPPHDPFQESEDEEDNEEPTTSAQDASLLPQHA